MDREDPPVPLRDDPEIHPLSRSMDSLIYSLSNPIEPGASRAPPDLEALIQELRQAKMWYDLGIEKRLYAWRAAELELALDESNGQHQQYLSRLALSSQAGMQGEPTNIDHDIARVSLADFAKKVAQRPNSPPRPTTPDTLRLLKQIKVVLPPPIPYFPENLFNSGDQDLNRPALMSVEHQPGHSSSNNIGASEAPLDFKEFNMRESWTPFDRHKDSKVETGPELGSSSSLFVKGPSEYFGVSSNDIKQENVRPETASGTKDARVPQQPALPARPATPPRPVTPPRPAMPPPEDARVSKQQELPARPATPPRPVTPPRPAMPLPEDARVPQQQELLARPATPRPPPLAFNFNDESQYPPLPPTAGKLPVPINPRPPIPRNAREVSVRGRRGSRERGRRGQP